MTRSCTRGTDRIPRSGRNGAPTPISSGLRAKSRGEGVGRWPDSRAARPASKTGSPARHCGSRTIRRPDTRRALMRYMMLIHHDEAALAAAPQKELWTEYGAFNEALSKAGVGMASGERLQPSAAAT